MKCFNCGSEMRHVVTVNIPPTPTRHSFHCDRCDASEITSNPTFSYGKQDTFDTADVDAATLHRLVTDRMPKRQE